MPGLGSYRRYVVDPKMVSLNSVKNVDGFAAGMDSAARGECVLGLLCGVCGLGRLHSPALHCICCCDRFDLISKYEIIYVPFCFVDSSKLQIVH